MNVLQLQLGFLLHTICTFVYLFKKWLFLTPIWMSGYNLMIPHQGEMVTYTPAINLPSRQMDESSGNFCRLDCTCNSWHKQIDLWAEAALSPSLQPVTQELAKTNWHQINPKSWAQALLKFISSWSFILKTRFFLAVRYFVYNTFCDQEICGACLEVVWRFEWRTFYISSLKVKLILACQEVLKWVWPCSSFRF